MLNKLVILTILVSTFFFHSCVSSKKYNAAQADLTAAQTEMTTLRSQNQALQQQVTELTSQQKNVTAEFSSYKSSCEATKEKLEFLQAALKEELNTLAEMEKLINEAVENFEGQGLEVLSRNGRIYVNMAEKLLYKSGSSKLNENGLKALEALASALNQYPNLQVIVVGHTDNVPFKDGSHTDNLRLSTDRANEVVRALRDKYQVTPVRLVAAGQGFYAPLDDNSTAEGRAKNRRTEIILNPDIKKIWEIAKTNQ